MMERIMQVLARLHVAAGISPPTNVSVLNSSTFRASSNRTARIASTNVLGGSNANDRRISKRSESVGNIRDKTTHDNA